MSHRKPVGVLSHKNPDCTCSYCTARRGKAKAIARGSRGGPIPEKVKFLGDKTVVMAEEGEVLEVPTNPKRQAIVREWHAYRLANPDMKQEEIAKRIGIPRTTLKYHIEMAVKEGWLKFNDSLGRIEHEIIPKILDNVSEFLDEKDKQVTIEGFKATVAKQFQALQEATNQPRQILAIKIELPPDMGGGSVAVGTMVGTPKVIDVTPDEES